MVTALVETLAKRTRQRPVKDETLSTRVLRLRLKDKHDAWLTQGANEVNFCWNFCNEHSLKVLQRERRFVSAFDLHPYMKGAGKAGLGLHSQTLQAVAEEFAVRRKQFGKAKLRWRVSRGARRSLGWIPFKASAIRYQNGQPLSLWDSYGLKDYVKDSGLGAGSISQDARGRWYLNVTVKINKVALDRDPFEVKTSALGIDLGLKDLVADSNGGKVQAQRFYRDLEPRLAIAQRANKKDRVKSIHAKIANRRKDFSHKLSTAQVRHHLAIFVGDVDAQKLTQTRMAKSVLDAGWSSYRTMLKYKCDDAGVWFKEMNESYSSQECGACQAITGPKGLAGLGVRQWTCSACGAAHDRDTNSAGVIKARGLSWLKKEFAAAGEAKAGEPTVNKDSRHKLTKSAVAAAAGHGRPVEGIPVL